LPPPHAEKGRKTHRYSTLLVAQVLTARDSVRNPNSWERKREKEEWNLMSYPRKNSNCRRVSGVLCPFLKALISLDGGGNRVGQLLSGSSGCRQWELGGEKKSVRIQRATISGKRKRAAEVSAKKKKRKGSSSPPRGGEGWGEVTHSGFPLMGRTPFPGFGGLEKKGGQVLAAEGAKRSRLQQGFKAILEGKKKKKKERGGRELLPAVPERTTPSAKRHSRRRSL